MSTTDGLPGAENAIQASSRIFVKGLPPTFTDNEFRKHFSQSGREITDAKIFSNRRIGYVGYKTPQDAQNAVKYFNKTFIRMSRIGVELARPVEETKRINGGDKGPIAERDDQELGISDPQAKLKRKRDVHGEEEQDPKLKEFLDAYKSKGKKPAWEHHDQETVGGPANVNPEGIAIPEEDSDDDYEQVPKKVRREKTEPTVDFGSQDAKAVSSGPPSPPLDESADPEDTVEASLQLAMSDADWARSRTSRLLGLLDDDEGEITASTQKHRLDQSSDEEEQLFKEDKEKDKEPPGPIPTPPLDGDELDKNSDDPNVQAVRSSMRLFLRNLPYDVTETDLTTEFASFGDLEEIHVPIDKKTGSGKGFAYVQYSNPDSAERALVDRDGQVFQGRLIHILPATARRETKLDDFALSKLPLKKQQEIKRRREATSSSFNWNALYMNADAVVSTVADRLGLSKSQMLDPTSSDAAIRQAHAETHIIQETKSYFRQHGVDLDSFKRSQRGDMAILVKNIPYDCSREELRRLFEEQGDVTKFLMPPSGTIAIVGFANAAQCKTAFGALAYRKMKSSVLFLEKAPKDVFAAQPSGEAVEQRSDGISKVSTSDLRNIDHTVPESAGTATLFVRNLNFSTDTEKLTEAFKKLDGFMSARVKTKTDPKKPGQILSMGFGFLEFRTAQLAQTALQTMDGYTLEGHKLQIRASHKGADAAEERRKADTEKKTAGRQTKVIIKNLPFEATKKDVRALFGAYGQLRSVRVPKKMDRAARGFAFADFATVKEAQNAMDALRDTHLLGRRLVLDFAAEDPEDAEAEIEKMQQKVGAQVNKVALQKLTGVGRKKFTTQNDEDTG